MLIIIVLMFSIFSVSWVNASSLEDNHKQGYNTLIVIIIVFILIGSTLAGLKQ